MIYYLDELDELGEGDFYEAPCRPREVRSRREARSG